MNKLILYPLLVMVVCSILTQALKATPIGFDSTQQTVVNPTVDPNDLTFREKWAINHTGQTSGYSVPTIGLLGIDGFLALLIVFVAIGAIAGIHFLGSGLSDSSINIIYKSAFYYTLWGVFSVLGLGVGDYGLSSIPIFGTVIYIVFTLMYIIGVQSQINTHES